MAENVTDTLRDAVPLKRGDKHGYVFDNPPICSPLLPFTRVMEGFWVAERDIPHEFRPWRPFVKTMAFRPDGSKDPEVEAGRELFYANSHYLVFVREMAPEEPDMPPAKHLSMRTVENDVRHDWREMQRVKNELCGEDWEGVELYPAEDRVVDTANQFHLWCFPFRIPFGFDRGIKADGLEATIGGGNQRPLEDYR